MGQAGSLSSALLWSLGSGKHEHGKAKGMVDPKISSQRSDLLALLLVFEHPRDAFFPFQPSAQRSAFPSGDLGGEGIAGRQELGFERGGHLETLRKEEQPEGR